jgi:omega-6 fatty acid desaturase (delta-12 desaturase)
VSWLEAVHDVRLLVPYRRVPRRRVSSRLFASAPYGTGEALEATLANMASAVLESDPVRSWRGVLDRYAEPRLGRSLLDLGTSVVPYLVILTAMFFALRVSVLLMLVLVVPASGFLIRSFIVFHDCTHGSFLRSRRGNNLLGRAIGLLVWMPFRCWQHEHSVHHATSGDLDRRGIGDIKTLTVAEYRALPVWERVGYRLFRNPVVMFGLGWLIVLVLKPRFVPRGARRRIRTSVLGTNFALAAIVAVLCFLLGWRDYLLVQGPVFFTAGALGVWLFYVQHQFEDAYWQAHADWRYLEAALEGSSYLKLPSVLQFFTGNIGFHHVHHLSVGIPNYNLQRAHEETELLQAVPELTLRDGLRATRLKLWDERSGRLVTFGDAHA